MLKAMINLFDTMVDKEEKRLQEFRRYVRKDLFLH